MKTRESLEERFAVKEKDKTLKESRHYFGGHVCLCSFSQNSAMRQTTNSALLSSAGFMSNYHCIVHCGTASLTAAIIQLINI